MIFREVDPTWGVSVRGKRLSDLRYADDTAHMAESETELQRILNRVKEIGKEFGINMNVNKTKTMVVSKKDVIPQAQMHIHGQLIEQVLRFTYLGQLITEEGKCEEEIKRLKGQARTAFNNMKTVLCC